MTAAGTIFEGFRLLRPLGKGWLGQVFAAQNLDGAKVQALRIVAPELVSQPQVMTQFRRLFEKWRRLAHPNILTPDELYEREQHVLYSMALAQSGSVRQLLQTQVREGQFMDMLVAVDLARQVAGALAYAHDHNLMHGDLKPENLLLTPARALLGRQAYGVLVSDFGVGELQAFTHGVHDRQIVTTPAYMSPEQCKGIRTEVRTDIYSLGVILYELLTNLVPFETKELAEAMDKHLHVAPIPPGQIRVDIPADLEEVVLTCMAKAPEYRYRSAHELEDALQRVLNGLLPQGPRPTVVLPDIPEPPAPRIEPLRDRVPFPRIQVCDARGQLLRVESLKDPSSTLGRAPGNGIVLEHAGVSRHHLGLEVTPEEGVYVTDLGSTNGTTLGGLPLEPRERTLWPDGTVLRIEPFWLRLQPPQRVVQQARIGVLVEDNDITLKPGEPFNLPVQLANTGKTVDHFRMEVEGVPPEWVHNLYHELQLNPGTTVGTSLQILVPRDPKYHADTYAVKVVARSRENNTEFGFAPMKWTVTPFTETVTEFSPKRRSAFRRTHYEMRMRNASNVPITYKPNVSDDEGLVKLQAPWEQIHVPSSGNLATLFPIRAIIFNYYLRLREGIGKVQVQGLPETVELQPGEELKQRVNVRLPIRWIATPRSRQIVYHPNPDRGPDHPSNMSLLHLPLVPLWALPLLLLAGLAFGMWMLQAPKIVSVTTDPPNPMVGQRFFINVESRQTVRIQVKPFNKTLMGGAGPLLIPNGITEPTEIQVIAYGRIKTDQFTKTITPKLPAPVIKSFTVTPQNITAGQQATVKWEVTNVEEVELEPFGTVAAKGQRTVTINQDTPFKLTVKANGGGSDKTKTVPVRILPAEIEIFDVQPSEVRAGETVKVRWRVRNAQSVEIDPIGTVESVGEQTYQVTRDQVFTIRAVLGGGVAPKTRSKEVKLLVPSVDFFEVSPSDAKIGDTVTVQWKVSNASTVTIDPLGTVGPEGSQSYQITGPTQFRITAGNGVTSTDLSKSVNASARPPRISAVSVSPQKPRSGAQVTISWDTQDAEGVQLVGLPQGDLALPPSGSRIFTAPDQAANLTLIARGADGATASRSVPLPVLPAEVKSPTNAGAGGSGSGGGTQVTPPKPQASIEAFAPQAASITQGGATTLRWRTSGVDQVKLFPPGEVQSPDGSVTVRPQQTTTYTLVAGNKTQRITVTVKPKPITVAPPAPPPPPTPVHILSFSADHTVLTAGQTANLRWNVTGTNRVKVFPPGTVFSANGRLVVRPTQTTTYKLVAGEKSQTYTITVKAAPVAAPAVRILSFRADDTSVTAGDTVTLSWNVTGVGQVKLLPAGNISTARNTLSVKPKQTTTYTLVAGGQQESVTVQVTPAAPKVQIQSFTASDPRLTAGESVTLRWSVTGAGQVRIDPLGHVATANNQLLVRPEKTTTYTLVAGSESQRVTVTVVPLPVNILSFGADRASVAAGQAVNLRWSVSGTPRVKIFPQGALGSASGSMQVKPKVTTTYTLVAGDKTQKFTVTVRPAVAAPPPNPSPAGQTGPSGGSTGGAGNSGAVAQRSPAESTIELDFDSDTPPGEVPAGTRVTLTWRTSGARSVYLAPVGTQRLNDSLTRTIMRDTTFRLEARNGDDVKSQELTFRVKK